MTDAMHHFTDKDGFNGIRAQSDWRFRASQPPAGHPFGAYFTTHPPRTPTLAIKLGIPKRKTEYVFTFEDRGDLQQPYQASPHQGGRGKAIFYWPADYVVVQARQQYKGPSGEAP